MVVGLAIGVIEALVTGYLSSSLRDAAAFFVLIGVLYFRPNGLFRLLCDLRQANEPREHGAVAIFTLLNVAMALGLYITAMSGSCRWRPPPLPASVGYLAAVLTVKFGWALLPATCLAAIAGGLVGTMLALLTLKMRDFHPEADDACLLARR